jgi:hypothetical protein
VRRLLLISFILGIGITATGSAAADTLTIAPPATPIAETIVTVALTGNIEILDPSGFAFLAAYAEPNASTCPASPTVFDGPLVKSAGPFSVTTGLYIAHTGTYLLCGYLENYFDTIVSASAEMTVNISEAAIEAQAKQAVEATALAEAQAKQAAEAKALAEAQAKQAAEAKALAEVQAKKAAGAQATNAHEAEELHAQEITERNIEKGPATLLRVKAVSRTGRSSSHPGHTTLIITTSPLVHVTVTFNHHARSHRFQASGNEPALFEVEQGWSCGHPGLTYHYVVTAVGGSGSALRRSGNFRTVSSSRCAALRVADEHRSAERHREAEEERREHESPKYKIEQAEKEYCEKIIGGRPGFPTTVAGHIYLDCERKGERIVVGEGVVS